MLSELDYTVLDILYQQGAAKIVMTPEDVGDEVTFANETEVLEFFNHGNWKGKTVTFSPTNTAQWFYTLAKPTQKFDLGGNVRIISKLQQENK